MIKMNDFELLRKSLAKLMSDYASKYDEVKNNRDWTNPFKNIITKDIPELLKKCSGIEAPYRFEGSSGKGLWTKVPWIALFDTRITSSAQKGAYIVYLLNKDEKELYLSFAIAATEAMGQRTDPNGRVIFSGVVGNNSPTLMNALSDKCKAIRNSIPNDYFVSDNSQIHTGASGYDYGSVYFKKYTLQDLPDGETIITDLQKMMDIYKSYYEISQENVAEWEPPLSEYDPGITKEQWLQLLLDPDLIKENCYFGLAAFFDNGGQGSCAEISEKYGKTPDFYRNSLGVHLAERITKRTGVPIYGQENARYWPVLFFGKDATNGNLGRYIWKLRPELYDALEAFNIRRFLTSSHPIGRFDSWEIVDENIAIKNCDKSFYEYNGSGVPKGICWFFDAEDLQPGEKKNVTLLYKGENYSARVVRSATGTKNVTIDWLSDLGDQFKALRKGESQRLEFIRNGDSYSISFIGGEEEMPLKSIKEAIAGIKDYISSRGFTYPDGMIENFYLSLKSKPFVILAGTSGTGKTRLVKLFAEAIGAEYFLVPVRPDWSDGSDLFGHYDLSGHFIEGPICSAFEAAVNNPDKPVVICLDEMNLARVEYYLSDFLSVIESREKQPDGKIKTVGIAQYAEGIPSNIYIVDTVNMDETTFPFSKKVLDRANTIEFNYVDLAPTFDAASRDTSPIKMKNTMLRAEYLVLVRDCFGDRQYVQGVCDELKKINEILKKANAHVGYRVRDEIVFYMLNNRKAENLLPEDEAMDNEILQKILPRIQGSSVAIKDMLVGLFKYCMADHSGIDSETGHAGHYMQNLADSAKYKNSARKIGFMMTRYEEDGFTSYWL